MQRELTGWHVVLFDSIVKQRLEQGGGFRVGHTPADHAAAEDVEYDVEIEVAPLRWAHQLGDVPGPDLVWTLGQQFGLLVGGMAQLLATFVDLAVLLEDAIHGADRAVVDTLVEQGCINLRRCLVGETWCMQQIQYRLLLRRSQCPGWCRTWQAEHRRRGQTGAPSFHRGARHPNRGANRRGHAADRRQRDDGIGQGPSPSGAIGIPSRSASFFWTAMIASARARHRVR